MRTRVSTTAGNKAATLSHGERDKATRKRLETDSEMQQQDSLHCKAVDK